MNAPKASQRWQNRQVQALHDAYNKAWHQGARNYHSQYATPPVPRTAGPKPTAPNIANMQKTLAAALATIASIGVALAAIVPTTAQITAAGGLSAATITLMRAYLATVAWRLALAVYVVWVAEQAGYAEAAQADGLLLKWTLDPSPDIHHCVDCPGLASLPPMPLEMWPTLPGMGDTECNVGCRCSMQAVAAPIPSLSGSQEEILRRVAVA